MYSWDLLRKINRCGQAVHCSLPSAKEDYVEFQDLILRELIFIVLLDFRSLTVTRDDFRLPIVLRKEFALLGLH